MAETENVAAQQQGALSMSGNEPPRDGAAGKPLRPENQRMLAWLAAWRQTPLTNEERAVLDDFEAFRRDHPFSLASSSDK